MKKDEITLLHFMENDEYYISKMDFKRSLAVGARILAKQSQIQLEIYGNKDHLLDTYYEVFSFEYPEEVDLKIYDVEKPIVLYQLMEDIDSYISEMDYGKALEKGADIIIDRNVKYFAPMIADNSILYKVNYSFFPQGIDVRFKKISKYYIERTNKTK